MFMQEIYPNKNAQEIVDLPSHLPGSLLLQSIQRALHAPIQGHGLRTAGRGEAVDLTQRGGHGEKLLMEPWAPREAPNEIPME